MHKKYFVASLLTLVLCGCDSESDEVTITNHYTTQVQPKVSENEQLPVGAFEVRTVSETDFLVVATAIDALEFNYTNANQFHFNKDGYLVNNTGAPLMSYLVNPDGSSASVSISTASPVKIDYDVGNPQATDEVMLGVNLPSTAEELAIDNFSNQNPLTYNHSTSIQVIDSLGESHQLSFYFVHTDIENNVWQLQVSLDNEVVSLPEIITLDFISSGELDLDDQDLDGYVSTGSGLVSDLILPLDNGANDFVISFDFRSDTQSTEDNFTVSSLAISGFYTDSVKALRIDHDGLITLSFVHQEDKLIGRVALAKFNSPYNLEAVGNDVWAETDASGTANYGEAEVANYGAVVPVMHDF